MPQLQLPWFKDICMIGDVVVDPGAVIGQGVILQAAPGSQITIAAGACIGSGSVLHAWTGKLEIQTGATLGAGVLVVGRCSVGAYACVGTISTIWNTDVPAEATVAPGSILGETGAPGRDAVASSQASASEVPASEPPAEIFYGQAKLNSLLGTLMPDSR